MPRNEDRVKALAPHMAQARVALRVFLAYKSFLKTTGVGMDVDVQAANFVFRPCECHVYDLVHIANAKHVCECVCVCVCARTLVAFAWM